MNKRLLILGILGIGVGLVLAQQANANSNNGGYTPPTPYTPQQDQQTKSSLQKVLDSLSPFYNLVKNLVGAYMNAMAPEDRQAMERILKHTTTIPRNITDQDVSDFKILKMKYPELKTIGFLLGL